MRSLLLFIGSLLYPTVMVIISPLLMFLYLLYGTLLFTRYLHTKKQLLLVAVGSLKMLNLHLPYRKQLTFRPKAVRLH